MNRISKLLAGAFCALGISGAADAAIIELDFVAEAAGNEGGVEGSIFTFDGIDVLVSSSHQAYLDDLSAGRPAGLGVCKVLDGANQCSPSSDDNVTSGEWVTLDFGSYAVTSAIFSFYDARHFELSSARNPDRTYLLGFDIPGGDLGTLGASQKFGDAFPMLSFNSVTFGYGGDHADEFYVSGATDVNVVPLPGVPALLGAGLIAFGVRRRHPNLAATSA